MKWPLYLFGCTLLFQHPSTAYGELWNPLDTVPRPNAIVGYDTSVTMRIDVGCTECHIGVPPHPEERATLARLDLLATMPLFRENFVFGAFEYQGCVEASIRASSFPDVGDPEASYQGARSVIQNAQGCDQSEYNFPEGSMTGCMTPTPLCSGDILVARDLLTGGLSGLSLGPLPTTSSVACDNPAAITPHFDVEGFFLGQVAGLSWPRWHDDGPSASEVHERLCEPLESILWSTRTELNRCLQNPAGYWNMQFLDGPLAAWCDPAEIAPTACISSPLVGTCVCDDTDPACSEDLGLPRSPCGMPMELPARQQVAVCESYDPSTFGAALRDQPDNRVNVGGCRENVALFFTDGYGGGTAGVRDEAMAAQSTYGSASGQSNMFAFRISDSFETAPDIMMQALSNDLISEAYSAQDASQMRTSFSQVLARIYRGDYAGTSAVFSASGDRLALSSFVVPGYLEGAPVSDRYIGWPTRVTVHEVRPNGEIETEPIYQTDWAERVNASPGACGPTVLGGTQPDLLGPGGRFDNGVERNVLIPAGSLGDRNSDGVDDPSRALQWGRSFGFASGRPVFVEAPAEVPNPAWGLAWADHLEAHRTRPRMLYIMNGGYVLGFHGGTHSGTAVLGGRYLSDSYDDEGVPAGTEVLRYRPSWMAPGEQEDRDPGFDVELNPLVQQRLTTGEIVAREVYLDDGSGSGGRFRTLLVGAQGKEGAGYFVLDVSDPCAPEVLSEWLLPDGSWASTRPEVYYMQRIVPGGITQRASVVTTGGLNGLPLLLAYDLRTGEEYTRVDLPDAPGTSYPSAAVCVDVTGEGVVTHCYAVRSDGRVVRAVVNLDTGRFSTEVDDITPVDDQGLPVTVGQGRVYSTEPAVFFGPDGAVNLVIGSGSHTDLTRPGPDNYVYRIVDDGTRRQGIPAQPARFEGVCIPDENDETSGVFALPPGDRVVSPPVVADGVVAWTTYRASSSGCVAGASSLYAMRYETCEDALGTDGPRPEPIDLGPGIPTAPTPHRLSGNLFVRTSAGGGVDAVGSLPAASLSPGQPWARRLYWRYELDVR